MTNNLFVTEKKQFYDEFGRFVTKNQMWRSHSDDFKFVINSSQNTFCDENGVIHNENCLS